MKRKVSLGGLVFAAVVSTQLVAGQEVPPFTFNVGAGFTTPVGSTGRATDVGWNGTAGAGVNFGPWVSTNLQFMFNNLGINSGTLSRLGAPDGTVQMWSLTLDPRIHLNPKGKVDMYLVGGGGLYHRRTQLTTPTVAFGTGFDPFFGFFPLAFPANSVLAEHSVYKPGFNAGAGFSFGSPWKGKFFMESRYHHMFLGNNSQTTLVPVTFGFKW